MNGDNPKPTIEPAKTEENYITKFVQLKKRTLIIIGVVLLIVAAYMAGVSYGKKEVVDLRESGVNVLNQYPTDKLTTVDYNLLWKVLKLVTDEYVDKPLDQKSLMYGAVR